MNIIQTPAYRKAFQNYLRYGFVGGLYFKTEEHPTTHYIWRTQGDGKVRASHAANNGKIFAWDNPPPTGHPGEDYNCRCWAEPHVQGKTEFAYQNLTSSIGDVSPKWTDYDLTRHFYLGGGRGVTLSEIGHLRGVVDFYFHALSKYNDVNIQIITAARKHPEGEFAHYVYNSYGFRPYLYVFGDGTVSGLFLGSVRHVNDRMIIQGKVEYFYDDVFTDPLDLRELLRRTSDPNDATALQVAISDIGGRYFPIKDYWKTEFYAEAKLNEESSIYRWSE